MLTNSSQLFRGDVGITYWSMIHTFLTLKRSAKIMGLAVSANKTKHMITDKNYNRPEICKMDIPLTESIILCI